MVFQCCVPKCRGNYPGELKVSTFAFPKNVALKNKWLKAICRDNFNPTNNTKVCEQHFQEGDIERVVSVYAQDTGQLLQSPLKKPRLKEGAVPSKLPGCAAYLSRRETLQREGPDQKRARLENQQLENAVLESIQTEEVRVIADSVSSFEELADKVADKTKNFTFNLWLISQKTDKINFFYEECLSAPVVRLCVSVNKMLVPSVFFEGLQIKSGDEIKIKSVCELEQFLDKTLVLIGKSPNNNIKNNITFIKSILDSFINKMPDKKPTIDFIKDQLSLLGAHTKYALRYSCETLLFCGLLHSISPHAYKFLRSSNILILPTPNTIRNLCSILGTDPRLEKANILQYVSSKFKLLDERDKLVTLMIDEIHLSPYIDFKGGNIVGEAFNSSDTATSAYVFMLNSLMSPYKEVAHILPVKVMQGEMLHMFIKRIILGLEDIGFEVLAVVSDNNRVNRKAMSFFCDPPEIVNLYPHPKDPTRPLFFVIDTVHILKNIRNNWLNLKPQMFTYPSLDEALDASNVADVNFASFDALKTMHSKERNSLLKYGYTLSLKALYPSSLERQNVKLALQIFNSSTVVALRELGPKLNLENYKGTADFIDFICRWWDVVNVKSLLKGQRNLNEYQQPFTKNSNHIFEFLNTFLNWLKKWDGTNRKGKLTTDTHGALMQSTDALLKIAKYCFEVKNCNFILPGQIQTDKLEERFGKYRFQSGSHYHVSVRQIYESESKLRLQSVLPLILKSKKFGDIKLTKQDILDFIDNTNVDSTEHVSDDFQQIVDVDESDLDDIEENIWPPLIYVAGYAAYAAQKKLKCDYCKVYLTESDNEKLDTTLISASSRGGLCFPSQDVVLCSAYVYLVTKKILEEKEHAFVQSKNQRDIIKYQCLGVLQKVTVFVGHSCTSHQIEKIINILLHSLSNILLNNYCKRQNDVIKNKNMPALKRIKPQLPQ